jgi:site-specific DNA recombinase
VIETEARVVRHVYEQYTVAGLSIGAIMRELNDQGVATRKSNTRWERSMMWAMLRNPAYRGTACFGKTRVASTPRFAGPSGIDGAFYEGGWCQVPSPYGQ